MQTQSCGLAESWTRSEQRKDPKEQQVSAQSPATPKQLAAISTIDGASSWELRRNMNPTSTDVFHVKQEASAFSLRSPSRRPGQQALGEEIKGGMP